ncbi:MAG TPA: MFS transporter [Myxococcales bacterium]|nr:MFS transporter [Myxococcales bacterium]
MFPASATRDARILIATRALRGFADGAVSVLLAGYLSALGFSPFQVGAIVTGTLLGSAALTLLVGLAGHTIQRRSVLFFACALMLATGLGFAEITAFWPLLAVAVAGTLNPSAGDVSVFLPTEQAVLAGASQDRDRTSLFAWYNVAGTLAGAIGALASGFPAVLERRGWSAATAQRTGFFAYAAIALLVALLYRGLSPSIEVAQDAGGLARPPPLVKSRRVVLQLSALFSLDSMGGGFVVQSLLVLWLYRRFALSVATAGTIFFAAGILAAFSQLAAGGLARRIGLVETMVYTHLPSNLLLVLAGLMPTAPLAIALLLARMAISSMDVPARQSFVMAVVPPEERAAASSVTNVPRSLAAALSPLLAGAMLSRSSYGWPLICGGLIKAAYDVILYVQFRKVRPHGGAMTPR